MRTILILTCVALSAVNVWAQTSTDVFQNGPTVLDGAGNLVIFDPGRSTTGVTITDGRRSFYPPKTRITVQHPGSTANLQTVTYDADVRVVGVGATAIYAIVTVYSVSGTTVTSTQSLIAIKANQALPAALSGFPTLALTGNLDARVGPSDYIALITEPERQRPPAVTAPTAARTAQVVHFNGTSFETTSTGTLP